jgi:hypothetical protein
MDGATISALAALAGSVVGGVTALGTSWLTQQAQARAQDRAGDRAVREALYRDFIVEASRLYGDALAHDKAEISNLVGIYAMISRMRVRSSPRIVENADRVVQTIVETYLSPNKTFRELHEMLGSDALDPLRGFSEACREELKTIGAVTVLRRLARG